MRIEAHHELRLGSTGSFHPETKKRRETGLIRRVKSMHDRAASDEKEDKLGVGVRVDDLVSKRAEREVRSVIFNSTAKRSVRGPTSKVTSDQMKKQDAPLRKEEDLSLGRSVERPAPDGPELGDDSSDRALPSPIGCDGWATDGISETCSRRRRIRGKGREGEGSFDSRPDMNVWFPLSTVSVSSLINSSPPLSAPALPHAGTTMGTERSSILSIRGPSKTLPLARERS
jgi:hypothetical protein